MIINHDSHIIINSEWYFDIDKVSMLNISTHQGYFYTTNALFIHKNKISYDSTRDAPYCCALCGQCMLQLTTDIENITEPLRNTLTLMVKG